MGARRCCRTSSGSEERPTCQREKWISNLDGSRFCGGCGRGWPERVVTPEELELRRLHDERDQAEADERRRKARRARLRSAINPEGHVVQAVQQRARRRHVVDRLGHEGPCHGRAVLGRTSRHSEARRNHLLDTDDLQGLHQLLLLLGERTQHALQLGKQGMLDRLPVGGEGDAQAIQGWLTAPSS